MKTKRTRTARFNWKRVGAMTLVAAGLIAGLTACNDHYAKADAYTCIFSGRDENRDQLLAQIAPGQNSYESGAGNDKDYEVIIPTSDRFYLASKDDTKRDTLNDPFYEGFAVGNIPVQVEGQVKFKFNLEKACDWYLKSGKRNADPNTGDLGFNARGAEAQAAAGWFHYLAENFDVTLLRDTKVVTRNYTWAQLKYDYDLAADPNTGVLKEGVAPKGSAVTEFGIKLGALFTKDLSDSIGGNYFCGTQQSTQACPDMIFYPSEINPQNTALITGQEQLETIKIQQEQDRAKAALLGQQQDAALTAEAAQQAINVAKIKTAEQNALLDPAVQKCLALAKAGLDCNGGRPNVYVNGMPSGATSSAPSSSITPPSDSGSTPSSNPSAPPTKGTGG